MKYSFSLRNTAITSGLLAAACLAACSPKEPEVTSSPSASPSASPTPASTVETFGFMSQMPQDVEMYIGAYHSRNVWQHFAHSNAYAGLRASNLFTHFFGKAAPLPRAQDALHFFSPNGNTTISRPNVLKLRHVVADALGGEFFVSLADGATEDLVTMRQFSDEIRLQQMKSQFSSGNHGKPDPQWVRNAIPALAPYIETLRFPPLLMGFKMSSQKAALQEEIDRVKAKLPAGVAQTTFNLGDKPFTSWIFVAGSILPQPRQDAIRNFLEANVQDKAVADRYAQALLARKIEIAFGYVGDYLLVSVGQDHSHLKLAASPAESLIHRAELSVLTPYAGKKVWMASWASQKALETASQPHFALLPFFENMKAALASSVSAQDIEQIETDLRRIDTKAQSLLRPTTVQAAVGVNYWQDGLRGEQYGGVLPVGLTAANALSMESTDLASNFVWLDGEVDLAMRAGLLDWLEDVTTTAFSIYHRAIFPKLSDMQRAQSGMIEALALPKLTDLYHITRDQLLKSLGGEGAMAVDLNGAVPSLPNIPAPIQQTGKLPRLASIKSVVDAKLLSQSWQSYLALARQISAMLPPKAQLPGGIPDAQNKDLKGSPMYFYPLPINTGDLLPNVTVSGGKDLILSTSPSFSSDISDALGKAGAGTAATALKFDIHMTALYDFAETWIGLLAAHPELLQNKPNAAVRLKNAEPHLLTFLKSLRVFQGIEGRIYEENGGLRISTVAHIQDIK